MVSPYSTTVVAGILVCQLTVTPFVETLLSATSVITGAGLTVVVGVIAAGVVEPEVEDSFVDPELDFVDGAGLGVGAGVGVGFGAGVEAAITV